MLASEDGRLYSYKDPSGLTGYEAMRSGEGIRKLTEFVIFGVITVVFQRVQVFGMWCCVGGLVARDVSRNLSASIFIMMIYLLTAIGLSPGGRSTVHIYTQTIRRTMQNKQYIEQHNNFGRV